MDVTDFLRIIALPLLRILPKFPPDSVNLVQSFLLRVPQMLGGSTAHGNYKMIQDFFVLVANGLYLFATVQQNRFLWLTLKG